MSGPLHGLAGASTGKDGKLADNASSLDAYPGESALPLVSIIMIFLNEERYIAEAIASVFAQTYPSWELILVDEMPRLLVRNGDGDDLARRLRRWFARPPARSAIA